MQERSGEKRRETEKGRREAEKGRREEGERQNQMQEESKDKIKG